MVRPRESKTLHRKQHSKITPYQRVHVETGTEVQANVDLEHDANMHTAVSDVTTKTIQHTHAMKNHQTTLRTQRREWADFLAEVAAEATIHYKQTRVRKDNEVKNIKSKWS